MRDLLFKINCIFNKPDHKPMKLFLSFLLLFTFNKVICQTEDTVPFDHVDNKHIVIKNAANKGYTLGSKSQLVKACGKARIKKDTNEMLGGFVYTYTYKGFETYFDDNSWDGSTVKGTDYTILLNGITYKVGDHISKLKARFPLSYKNRNHFSNNALNIIISHKGRYTDASVIMSYNSKGYITEITIAG